MSAGPTPSPAPTGGPSVPNAWVCVPDYTTAPDDTYHPLDQQCAVVGWQLQPGSSSTPTTASVTVAGTSPDIEYSVGVAVFLLAAMTVILMAVLVRQPR